MKKFILALAAMSMIATPAMAQSRDHRWGVDSNRHSPYYGQTYRSDRHHRSKGCGTLCGIIIGGIVVGAIANSNRNNRVVERYETTTVRTQTQVCQDIVKYDYYGNPYVAGRNCWYQ